MNRTEVLAEITRIAGLAPSLAIAVLDFLDSIGYEGGKEETSEPGYQEASMVAIAQTMADFYLALTTRGVPDYAAVSITTAFMSNAQNTKS